jgi:hypothetical protein
MMKATYIVSLVTIAAGLGCGGRIAAPGSGASGDEDSGASSSSSGGSSSGGSTGGLPCTAGVPLCMLATGQAGAAGIAAHGGHVYWTTPQAVMSVSSEGGNPTTIATGQNNAWAIAADDANVYWTNRGTESRAYADGAVMQSSVSGGVPVSLAEGQQDPQSMAVDAASVYWSTGQTVQRVPIGGGVFGIVASVGAPISAMAVGVDGVYFADAPEALGGQPQNSFGSVMMLSAQGESMTTVASGASACGGCIGGCSINGVAVNSGNVFWYANGCNGSFIEATALSAAGGTPTVVLTAKGSAVASMVVDEASVYWSSSTDGQGEIESATGMADETLASSVDLPASSIAMAVDATRLYWIANDSIYRLSPK